MDVRLVQLLGSFIAARSQYSLARLEYAMEHPSAPAPPVLDRVAEASERVLREDWARLEMQLEHALAFVKRDSSCDLLTRSVRELDQYARAIRWVMTVTERE